MVKRSYIPPDIRQRNSSRAANRSLDEAKACEKKATHLEEAGMTAAAERLRKTAQAKRDAAAVRR